MGLLLTTDAVSEPERLEFWCDLICETFVQLEVEPPRDQPIRGLIHKHPLQSLHLTEVDTCAQTVTRTPRQIARAREDYFLVSVQLCGQGLIEQDGRFAPLGPGDFAFYDSTRPYQLHFTGDFRQLVLQMPRSLLLTRLPQSEQLTAVALRGQTGLGKVTLDLVASVRAQADKLNPQSLVPLEDTLVGLLGACLGERIGNETLSRQREVRLARAKAFIREHLSDPELSAQEVAAAVNLSVRALHYLFADQHESVGEYIREMRLEACRKALSNPYDRRDITLIAMDQGFTHPAHFSRLFKQRYGLTPSEFRQSNQSL